MAHRPKNPAIPTRDGVSPSCVAVPHRKPMPWASVLDFLAERLPALDRGAWAARLSAGLVVDDSAQPVNATRPCEAGERLYYWRAVDNEPQPPGEPVVRFADDRLLVVDKPAFWPVTPGGRYARHSLMAWLKRHTGEPDLNPLHRIDRETRGLVVFNRRPADRNAYHALFRDRAVHKVYEAIAPRDDARAWPVVRRTRLEEDVEAFFRMVETDGPPNSETLIEPLEAHGPWARYRLTPLTGKRHQLRVHLLGLGLPIAGDQFYPRVRRGPDDPDDHHTPLRLLAQAIGFTDPVTGEPRHFTSGLALDWPDAPTEA